MPATVQDYVTLIGDYAYKIDFYGAIGSGILAMNRDVHKRHSLMLAEQTDEEIDMVTDLSTRLNDSYEKSVAVIQNYYERHLRDTLEETTELSPLEHGMVWLGLLKLPEKELDIVLETCKTYLIRMPDELPTIYGQLC